MAFRVDFPHHRLHQRTKRPAIQQGVAAIAMSLLTVAVAGATLGSFFLYRSQLAQTFAQEQRALLSWTHQSVRNFAAVHGRLPCPSASRSGGESCDRKLEKGWLPMATLLATNDVPLPNVQNNMAIRYMVNRGDGIAGADMAASGARYVPTTTAGEPPPNYPSHLVTTLDLCARLAATPGFEPPWRRSEKAAPVAGSLVGTNQMVYGVAVGAVGAPDSASGTNADFSVSRFESPSRPTSLEYKDKVSFTTAEAYHDESGCSGAVASLDTMALASAWVEEAASRRRSNIEKADKTAEMIDLGVISDGFYLGDSGLDLGNGIYNAADNAAKAITAALNPALWTYIPVHMAGFSKAVNGIAFSAVDTARNAVTLKLRIMQAQAFREMSAVATGQQVWEGHFQMLLNAHKVGLAARVSPPNSTDAIKP